MRRVLCLFLTVLCFSFSVCSASADIGKTETDYFPDQESFAIPVYEDYQSDDFSQPDIVVEGAIADSWEYGIIISDANSNLWGVSTLRPVYDFSAYVGTDCKVYGRVEYLAPASSPVPGIPSIALFAKETYCIVFEDGKVFTDYIGASCDEFARLPAIKAEQTSAAGSEYANNTSDASASKAEGVGGILVWIPTNGGTKYHSRANCSNMKNPDQVTLETAIEAGFTPCKRCH